MNYVDLMRKLVDSGVLSKASADRLLLRIADFKKSGYGKVTFGDKTYCFTF